MSNHERFDSALIRIRGGESIRSVVSSLYKNWRHYKKQCTESQISEIRAARWEYMSTRGNKTVKGRKRIIFTTTDERDKEVAAHCKRKKITVSRFMNSALVEALARHRS